MSAPLEIKFEARISTEIRKLGRLRMSEADIKRVGDVIGNVTLEVFGEELGRPMIGSKWQREAAARYTIAKVMNAQGPAPDLEMPAPSWLT